MAQGELAQLPCFEGVYTGVYSEVCVLAVDQETEGGQVGSQFGCLTAGRGQEGVVLQLLQCLGREQGGGQVTRAGQWIGWPI